MKHFEITEGIKELLDYRGHMIRCKVSNIEGMCDGVNIPMCGENRLSIQPHDPNKIKVETSYWIDVSTAMKLDRKTLKPVRPDGKLIDLGVKVKDSITGFEGTITSKSIHLNGCVTNHLTGEYNMDEGKVNELHIPEGRTIPLKVVVEPEKIDSFKKKGGFMERKNADIRKH